ncbi:Urb2/Npa2 family-domain-containing protein [Scheffersomyces xylosifermentans]|uniref:Urb2/Npa2 family-domain-containing protein n=1 Tax=Scheffersomyces xylosifermentans TaxID=1304137 RepID=UPI00315D10F2
MTSLNTAESLTKFLRSKTTSVEDIIEAANNVLSQKNQVFLPNKNIFLLELICDRVNDFSTAKFKSWKYQSEIWSLFIRLWLSLGEEPSKRATRDKIFKRVRFIDVIIDVLQHDPSSELLSELFDFIELVKSNTYIEIDESASVNVLVAYVTSKGLVGIEPALISKWSHIIKEIYHLPRLAVNFSPSKKNYKKFINDCMPKLLRFITNVDSEDCIVIFKDILKKELFSVALIGSFIQEVTATLNTPDSEMNAESTILLFNLAIDNLSSKEPALCEQLFTTITSIDKFNSLSESLLSILVRFNKSLSTEFFLLIYDNEIAKDKNQINWKLINYLLQLDIDLSMRKASEILALASSSSIKDEDRLTVGKSILEAYVKGRDVKEFFDSVWKMAIETDAIYKSQLYVYEVSRALTHLSSRQLDIILTEKNKDEKLPPSIRVAFITAITKGLLTCSRAIQDSVKVKVLQSKEFIKAGDQQWEIFYYMLCLYGNEVIITSNTFEVKSHSKYYYYTMLRLLELGVEASPTDDFEKKFIKYLEGDPSEVYPVLRRWTVVIDLLFSKSFKEKFTYLLFTSLAPNELLDYFNINGESFFERRHITEALVNYITVEMNQEMLPYLAVIPIYCFDKSQKKDLLDKLVKLAVDSSEAICTSSRIAIKHLLTQPSYRSSIETDFNVLNSLFECKFPESLRLSRDIFNIIWENHWSQLSTKSNYKYIEDVLVSISEKDNQNISSQSVYAMSEIILSNPKYFGTEDDNLRMLIGKLRLITSGDAIFSLKQLLGQKTLDIESITTILLFLESCGGDSTEEVTSIIKAVGNAFDSTSKGNDVRSLRRALFKLLVKTLPYTLDNALYLCCLYLIYQSSFDLDVSEDIDRFTEKISTEPYIYHEVLKYVIFSFQDVEKEYVGIMIKLLLVLSKHLKKDHLKESKQLYSVGLSIIASNIHRLDLKVLDLVLNTIRTNLSDSIWLINQYSLENILGILNRVAVLSNSESTGELIGTVYIAATQVMSHVLLFHRYKLSSRHHLVLSTCNAFMEPLCLKSHNKALSTNQEAAASYARLLGNLCEPKTKGSRENSSSLTTTTSVIKKALRKHLAVVLVNYVYLNLRFNFDSATNNELVVGIYNVFDVLSSTELQLVSSSLDIPGKSFYRTLYGNYKDHGKWKDS